MTRRHPWTPAEVAAFVASYTAADEPRIRFDWNGEHGERFVDLNLWFRRAVREGVLTDVGAAPLELVRDLFLADTRCSREAFGIDHGVGELAEALLRRGGPAYLDDYLEGKFQSFDAHLGSGFTYDRPLADAMLAAVRERLRADPGSPRAGLWRSGEELFVGWLTDLDRQAAELAARRPGGNGRGRRENAPRPVDLRPAPGRAEIVGRPS